MHSCLTLVDYTWKDSEESGTNSPNSLNRNSVFRLRRSARSLDGDTLSYNLSNNLQSYEPSVSSTAPGTSNPPTASFSSSSTTTRIGNRRQTRINSDNEVRNSTKRTDQSLYSSVILLNSRRPPIYATSKRLLRGPDRVWVPVGHCRYLLERDLHTGEIKWSPEASELLCSPRNLAEICMARLIRDWPCMLPSRRSSLRNMVSFLFGSRELQTNNSSEVTLNGHTSRRSVSASSHPHSSSREIKSSAEKTGSISYLTCFDLPFTVLINLISEAVLQRDCSAITGLIANWPCEQLIIKQLIPNEEYPLTSNYLTKPTFVLVSPENEYGNRNTLVKGPSLLDAFILGLLTRQPTCKLKSVDFTGFEDDCRVSIELSRLPILWMKPENRNSENVRRHLMASLHIGIPKKRLEAYFSRISTIYAFHEPEINHGDHFETVTIHLDCNMTVDEVALGLSLQTLTPFRFSCNRLLLQRLPEIHFPPYSLIRLFDPLSITQFELEDPTLGSSLAVVLPSAVGWLISLRNLRACSLPSCIPPPPEVIHSNPIPTSSHIQNVHNIHQPSSSSSSPTSSTATSSSTSSQSNTMVITSSSSNSFQFMGNNNLSGQTSVTPTFTSTSAACRQLNRALVSLRYLQRLGLARCHLSGQLKTLLGGLSQPLEYLNLQDCCLTAEDIHYLVYQWRPLNGLYELNLSRNNLSNVCDETLNQLVQTTCLKPNGRLVCLSIAYTCLATEKLIWLLSLLAGMDTSQSIMENDNNNSEESHSDKWIDHVCTLRVLCCQSFIPHARDQLHRILYRIIRFPKLHKLHLFPAFYAFPGNTETIQREMRANQLNHSRNYLRQRSRSDIEIL